MSFFKKFGAVLKSYERGDVMLSFIAVIIFLLMILKQLIFPYGLFGFGTPSIYTEGLVSSNGFQNINPVFVDYNEADREVSRLVFSGLMKYDPLKQAIVDDMATLTINEDKTQYTFTIRDGIKWHDGENFDVEDVYFTYHDVILDQNFQNEILKTNFAGVNIELIDSKTIKFTLEKPNVFFISNFTTGILPEHILGDVEPEDLLLDEFNKLPVGTGPYELSSPIEAFPDAHMQVTLSKTDNYYADPVSVESIRFVSYPSMDQLIEEINAVNGVVKVTGEYLEVFEENERFRLIPYELPQYTAVFLNMESAILKDSSDVRLALQKALDKDALVGEFEDKIRVDTPLMELDQEEWVYQPNMDQAQGALKEAGYILDEATGVRLNDDGEPLILNFIVRMHDQESARFEETQSVVAFLKNAWEEVGVGIDLEFLPDEEFKQRVIARQYDLLMVGQSLGYNLDTYSYWHSTQADPAGQNLSNYKSFQVDSLIGAIRRTFDEAEKKARLQELAEQIKDDIPAIFLYRPRYFYAIDDKVKGVTMENVVFPSDRLGGVSVWSFE